MMCERRSQRHAQSASRLLEVHTDRCSVRFMRCTLFGHRQRERPAMPLLRRADRFFRDRPITCLESQAETALAARWSSASCHVRSARSCPGRDAVRIAGVALVATKRCNVAVWPRRLWAGSFTPSLFKEPDDFCDGVFAPFGNQNNRTRHVEQNPGVRRRCTLNLPQPSMASPLAPAPLSHRLPRAALLSLVPGPWK